MQASESADLLNRFLSQSANIDVADVSLPYLKYLVGRNVLQTIPVAKFKHWDATLPLFTKSEYPDGRKASTQGVAPYTVLYATDATGAQVRHRAHRVPDQRADHHQRRHARHPPGPDRPADHQLGRPDQPGVQGQGGAAGQPDRRRDRRRHGGRGARRRQVRQQGQHDQGRDRQDDRAHDADQAVRPVPLVLGLVRPVGEPDGVRRGGDPVHVVARRHRRAHARHPLHVPAAEGRLSRLGLPVRHDEAPDRAEAGLRLRVPELVHRGLRRRVRGAGGLLFRPAGERQEVPQRRTSGITGTAASRPPRTSTTRSAS